MARPGWPANGPARHVCAGMATGRGARRRARSSRRTRGAAWPPVCRRRAGPLGVRPDPASAGRGTPRPEGERPVQAVTAAAARPEVGRMRQMRRSSATVGCDGGGVGGGVVGNPRAATNLRDYTSCTHPVGRRAFGAAPPVGRPSRACSGVAEQVAFVLAASTEPSVRWSRRTAVVIRRAAGPPRVNIMCDSARAERWRDVVDTRAPWREWRSRARPGGGERVARVPTATLAQSSGGSRLPPHRAAGRGGDRNGRRGATRGWLPERNRRVTRT